MTFIKDSLAGFKNFILRGNSVDLAVGVVIGASFNTIISILVKDILTPLVASIFQVPNFSGLQFIVNGTPIKYGDFLNSVISFILVGFAVYFLVIMPMNTFRERVYGPQAPKTKKCPECLSDIPLGANRCAFCAQKI